MAGHNYYLVTAPPSLGELGSAAPISLGQLAEFVRDFPGPEELVMTILLGDDLTQRQSFLAGEIQEVAPSVLSAAQASGQEALPRSLARDLTAGGGDVLPGDEVWEAYYRHASHVARRRGSEFLTGWVSHEVGLRNALASARAKHLGLDPAGYLVAADLAETTEEFEALVGEWSSAAHPLEALRTIDRARWEWLRMHDAYFSFGDDELAAYAARLVLLHRWDRLGRAAADAAHGPAMADQPTT